MFDANRELLEEMHMDARWKSAMADLNIALYGGKFNPHTLLAMAFSNPDCTYMFLEPIDPRVFEKYQLLEDEATPIDMDEFRVNIIYSSGVGFQIEAASTDDGEEDGKNITLCAIRVKGGSEMNMREQAMLSKLLLALLGHKFQWEKGLDD